MFLKNSLIWLSIAVQKKIRYSIRFCRSAYHPWNRIRRYRNFPVICYESHCREGFPLEPNFILGVLSCVIWTLTLQTTVKYVIITLERIIRVKEVFFLFLPCCGKAKDGYIFLPLSEEVPYWPMELLPHPLLWFHPLKDLKLINPAIKVVPIVLIILTLLFAIQQFGTDYIGKFFGPVMFLWFLMLGILGFLKFTNNLSIKGI